MEGVLKLKPLIIIVKELCLPSHSAPRLTWSHAIFNLERLLCFVVVVVNCADSNDAAPTGFLTKELIYHKSQPRTQKQCGWKLLRSFT